MKLKLDDGGVFQLDMGHIKNGHEVYSSLKGTCDAGQLIAIGKKAGFTYTDIASGVDFSDSKVLPELKKFLVASASFRPVQDPVIKRDVARWVISGAELGGELSKWGLSNPGGVFSKVDVLGVDLDGKGDLKVPVSSGKRPIKSGFGGDAFSVLVSEVGPDAANEIKEWWLNDGGELGPDALFDKLSEVFGEIPTESFVDALEGQFFEELEGGMGGPSPVGSSHKAPVRSGVGSDGWDEIPEEAIEDHGRYRVYKGDLAIERLGEGRWEWTGPGFSIAGTKYPTARDAWDAGASMREQGRLKKGMSGHDGMPLPQYSFSLGRYVN
jgi:hypothetical protein